MNAKSSPPISLCQLSILLGASSKGCNISLHHCPPPLSSLLPINKRGRDMFEEAISTGYLVFYQSLTIYILYNDYKRALVPQLEGAKAIEEDYNSTIKTIKEMILCSIFFSYKIRYIKWNI
jgi:hypothetical protein